MHKSFALLSSYQPSVNVFICSSPFDNICIDNCTRVHMQIKRVLQGVVTPMLCVDALATRIKSFDHENNALTFMFLKVYL